MSIQRWAATSYDPYCHPYQNSGQAAHLAANIVVCRLCGHQAIQPTYLRCKHSFCNVCLQRYVVDRHYHDSLDFPCPQCQCLSAPPWGIWHLSHKVLDQSHDELYQTWKYEAMCDNCAVQALYATAGRHCQNCNVNLCDTCSYTHTVMAPTRSHCIVTLKSKTGAKVGRAGSQTATNTGNSV